MHNLLTLVNVMRIYLKNKNVLGIPAQTQGYYNSFVMKNQTWSIYFSESNALEVRSATIPPYSVRQLLARFGHWKKNIEREEKKWCEWYGVTFSRNKARGYPQIASVCVPVSSPPTPTTLYHQLVAVHNLNLILCWNMTLWSDWNSVKKSMCAIMR